MIIDFPEPSSVASPRASAVIALAAIAAFPGWDGAAAQATLEPLSVIATLNPGRAGAPRALAVSPDGRYIISGHANNVAIVWEPARRRSVHQMRSHQASVIGAGFIADGVRVVTADSQQTIMTWEATTGRSPASVIADQLNIMAMAPAPDGRALATCGSSKSVRLLDLTTGKPIWSKDAEDGFVAGLAFSPNGALLASGSQAAVTLWNVATGEMVARLPASAQVWSVAFSADGKQVAGAQAGLVRVWDIAERKEVAAFKPPPGAISSHFRDVAFLPDGRHVLVADSNGDALAGAIATSQFVAASVLPKPKKAKTAPRLEACRIAVSRDGEQAYAASCAGPIVVLDLKRLRQAKKEEKPEDQAEPSQ